MFKSRMLDAIKQSRYIPPIWLAILIAIGFVYGGRFAGMFGMFPIGLVIGILFRATNPAGGQAALMEFFRHYSLFFELFTFFFIALVVFLWVRYREKRPFSSLGFYKQDWFKNLLKGFLIGAVQFSLVVVLLLVTGTGSLKLGQLNLQSLIFVVAIIPFWILQGGTEELVTRGWLFPAVSAKSNIFIGILISSALFGALHLFNPGVTVLSIVNIILDGIFACFLMLKYDNMWVLAGMHGAWNFVQGNIYGIQVSGQGASTSILNYSSQSSVDLLSGGAFGAEGSIFASIVLIGCIAYLYWSLKKENRLPQALMFKK
ncbi:CPBP family intramembrane metalloprotease [Streptococcus sanguinis]|uniref:CAAX amino protease n=2 Tax=Streptococcus sanguinis TaxID=1305 RepID=F0I6S0_STRSA|nr:type II CAAX endopeptidase family protein [Streptococcus sanguinis]EGD32570.1 CAAX amino protease [Streptococcus sanguinis SK115]MBZ2052040.1 CPBP family intramembrane metalloprotease [Streptococcus sanguinis]MCY7012868.1 CPBP family intramembrane metalloprotease [Streptococcus sanguinis]MCY7032372.1 CPBP family intramembrane metalloprotease [Streptococcus sanguinis]RRC89871.1 CPBP family intramembrane metalloprotease [Streptococcus sanguinis]